VNALETMRALAKNASFANHRLLGACAQLSHADLVAPRVSFFPSILETLNHIVLVDQFYLDALVAEGRGRSIFAKGHDVHAELEPLREAQRAVDAKLLRWLESLTSDADLDRPVNVPRADHVSVERAGLVLLHTMNHAVHHRGQVHAMLAGTVVKPPQLDEGFLDEDLPLRRTEVDELGLR
jgi:uncharacterized damage-inducible protein DinB